ncbi:Mnat1, partial [Symbiodinium pilosum]
VRVLFSAICEHRICDRCLPQALRTRNCPGCGIAVRHEDFSEMPRDCREVDRELKVRRQVRDIYCKTEQDFPSGHAWDEYLVLREDIIYKLLHGSKEEVHETWRQIERYKVQHAESIRQVQRMRPKKALEKVAAVIKTEGDFASRVNADWLDRMELASHPFQEHYEILLGELPRSPDASLARATATASPLTPQPLMAGTRGAVEDAARRCSGGGQLSGLSEKKAKHFFFADLATSVRRSAVESH